MYYQNPILPGFHPDPSICRVGDDFYLVNSSFEYFPGIPLYHSRDLIHWEQIGHCLTRNSQVTLAQGAPNRAGIYAPTIRYHNGTFYCIVTSVGGGENFFVTTDDIYGEWSEPVMLPDFQGIDPSLFFDDDGKVYYSGTDKSIYVCEIDLKTGKPIGEKHYVWGGTGGNNPEGPHLYKIDGMYYLMIAEGGTELNHAVTIARSQTVFGEYESCPHNPILTNRGVDLPVKAVGHADLVEDNNGRWWAVCLGNRPIAYPFLHILGRETFLTPVIWKDGWPMMGKDGHIHETVDTGENPVTVWEPDGYRPGSDMTDMFQGKTLHPSWNRIYNPVEELILLDEEGLVLCGNEVSIWEDRPKALLCRRQEHFAFCAKADLKFLPENDLEEAGISIYLNNRHHYEIARTMMSEESCLIVRRQIGSLKAIEKVIPYEKEQVTLRITGTREAYTFSFGTDGIFTEAGSGETAYLSTETGGCFTGNYIALYASGNGRKAKAKAHIISFTYEKMDL